MTFFTGTGRHRAQIIYFFRWQIGLRTPSGTCLGSGSRLDRVRRFSVLAREVWIQNSHFGSLTNRLRRILADVSLAGSARARAVGDCTCTVPTLSDPRETSGPRIDRFPPTRPPCSRRQYRELKKIIFSAPSTCPIDLFGPLSNRTILKRLHVASGFEH